MNKFKNMIYIYNSVIKKKKILPLATICMNPEGIMLSKKVRQRKTNTV